LSRLILPEELMLVALQPDGRVHPSATRVLDYGLAAGILLELTLRGRIEVVEGKLICNEVTESTGEEILDGALREIADSSAEGGRAPAYWVRLLWPGKCRWRDRIAGSLVEKRVLVADGRRLVYPLGRRMCRVQDTAAADEIMERVRSIMLGNAVASQRDVMLASLVRSANLTKVVVPLGQRRKAKRTVAALAPVHSASDDVDQVVLDDMRVAAQQMMQEMRLMLDAAVTVGGDGGGGGNGGGG
jgi:hypothetical protein